MTVADGMYLIGSGSESGITHIAPGIYESAGASPADSSSFWYVGNYDRPMKSHVTATGSPDYGPTRITIPAEAYSFESNGYGPWTRVGDPPGMFVKTSAGWRNLTAPHETPPLVPAGMYNAGERAPWQLRVHRNLAGTGINRWYPQSLLVHPKPMRVKKADGSWVEVTDFYDFGFPDDPGAADGYRWSVDRFGGYYPVSVNHYWVGRGLKFADLSYPTGLAWWGALADDFALSSGVNVMSHVSRNWLGQVERDMYFQVRTVDLDVVRFLARAYNPTGQMGMYLAFRGNPTLSTIITGSPQVNTAGEAKLYAAAATDVDAHVHGAGYDAWQFPMLTGRDLVPRSSMTARGSRGELLHTFTGVEPLYMNFTEYLYPLDLPALAGTRHLDFWIEATDPLTPPAPPSGSSETRDMNGSLDLDVLFTPAP